MSIQKKSLINTLKSAKKANVVKEEVTVSSAIASPSRHVARMAPTKRARIAGATKRLRPLSPRVVN